MAQWATEETVRFWHQSGSRYVTVTVGWAERYHAKLGMLYLRVVPIIFHRKSHDRSADCHRAGMEFLGRGQQPPPQQLWGLHGGERCEPPAWFGADP